MAGQQFPGFVPLQYAQPTDYSKQLAALTAAGGPLAKAVNPAQHGGSPAPVALGAPVPGASGPTAVGGSNGPMPIAPGIAPGMPGAAQAGPVAPPPTLMDALRNMSPSQIMASLQRASQPVNPAAMSGGAPGMPPGAPPMGMAPGGNPGAQSGSALFQQAGMADPSTFGG